MLLKIILIGTIMLSTISVCMCNRGVTIMSVNAEGGLKMRQAPNINSKSITVIPNFAIVDLIERGSEEVVINGKRGRWMKIRFLDATGWAFGAFLSESVQANRKIDPQEILRNGESFNFLYDGGRKENDEKLYLDGECTAYSWKLHADGGVSATYLKCSGIDCHYEITSGKWTLNSDSIIISAKATTPQECPGFSQENLNYRFDSFRKENIHIANYSHKSFEILQAKEVSIEE